MLKSWVEMPTRVLRVWKLGSRYGGRLSGPERRSP